MDKQKSHYREATDLEMRKHKQDMPHASPYWRFSSIFLLFQFILVMIATHTWTLMEGNHVMYMTDGCRGEMADNDQDKKDAIIADMILYMSNFQKKRNYLGRYICCNILSLAIVVGIAAFYLYLFDWFFTNANEGGGYSIIQVFQWTKSDNNFRDDPLIKMFPRRMGCDIEYFGPSGTRQMKEFKCTSQYNEANETIHVGAFVLFSVLVAIIFLNTIYTIFCVICLTATCFRNTRFRKAADPLNNNQRFLFLLVCKNVGYDVKELLLERMESIIKKKEKMIAGHNRKGMNNDKLPIEA